MHNHSHLTKLIEAWLIRNGVENNVTRSVLEFADIINIAKDTRIVIYDKGYWGKSHLSGYDYHCRVLTRVVLITDCLDIYRVKWVHPHDPDFFSAIAEHLRLGSFSKVESYKRLAYESSV